MAERRMFSKSIIDSDLFLDMPVSARLLYFDLAMRADDDGFINSPKKIARMTGASKDDLEILAARSFLIPFETGVVVIKHWKIHNYIRKDTYNETMCKDEKKLLGLDQNNAYLLASSEDSEERRRLVDGSWTQVRLGKDRLGKDRLGKRKVSKEKEKSKKEKPSVFFPEDEKLDLAFKDFIQMRKEIKAPMTERAITLSINKLQKLSGGDNDKAIAILEQSIMNSWKGLFELHKEKTVKDELDEWANA